MLFSDKMKTLQLLNLEKVVSSNVLIMVFNAICNNFSVISWWKAEFLEKTTDPPQVTDKLYYIILYRTSSHILHRYLWTGHSIPPFYPLPPFFFFFFFFISMA